MATCGRATLSNDLSRDANFAGSYLQTEVFTPPDAPERPLPDAVPRAVRRFSRSAIRSPPERDTVRLANARFVGQILVTDPVEPLGDLTVLTRWPLGGRGRHCYLCVSHLLWRLRVVQAVQGGRV